MASVDMQDRVERFDTFFRDYCEDDIAELAQHYPAERRSLYIDWTDLYRFDEDLAEDLRTHPDQLVAEAEEALRLFDLPVDVSLGQAHVRIRGLPETTVIRDIRAEDVNRLVSVRGIIRKATGVKPRIVEAAFECQRCGTMTRVPQGGGRFQEPHQCQACERKGPFRIDEAQSKFIDAQRLRIQESPEGLRGGQTPESIDVHIEDDATGGVSPGDSVRATGTLRLEQQSSGGEESTLFDIYMDGMAITAEEEQFDEMDITEADKAEIVRMSEEADVYDKMVDSIAPSIFGYENTKLAMVLQLFSGVTKHLPDGSRTRGDMHLLLIGDPGTGKSKLLQYTRHIAPRSVYTSGKGSSAAGITAAAVRDDFGDGQQWTLEAGALVLADQGIAAIDELDKMRCVTGDTLVHLADDGPVRMRELAHEAARDGEIEGLPNGRSIRDVDRKVWTMTEDGRLTTRRITAIHEYEAPRQLSEVNLATGEQIKATPDHPFITYDAGERMTKPACELKEGEWVYVPARIPSARTDGGELLRKPRRAEESGESVAMGAVLGYLSGDGNVFHNRQHGSYGARFTNKEHELLTHFETMARRAFGKEPTRPPSEQRPDGVETVRIVGKAVVNRVLAAGMNLRTFDEKSFPRKVSEGSLDTKAAFVRALADSEGSVDTTTGNMAITSSSYELLLGTKHLLLEFGVSSQIHSRRRSGKRRDIHELMITSADSLRRYRDRIGFELTRKQRALAEVCKAASGDRTIIDVIPDAGELLHELRSSLRLHQSECGLTDATYCNFEKGVANISLHRAENVLDAFERRIGEARLDRSHLGSGSSWKMLEELKERYHVSQQELSEGIFASQPSISENWGRSERLRKAIVDRIDGILADVIATNVQPFSALVTGDVKWRRVESVREVKSSQLTDKREIACERLADILGCEPDAAVDAAGSLLSDPVAIRDWEDIPVECARHGFGYTALADELQISDATITRWVNGVVETDRFHEVKRAASKRCNRIRGAVAKELDAIESTRFPKVFDLTVEGTHNYVANGMIVHNSEDRSALHEGLEAQEISISKAGINATLKARCSLLGAANPKYGRFDQYEPMSEQIDLEPALISRFDLIFTVTDQPDEIKDREMADHILETNYAGELHTRRQKLRTPDVSDAEVEAASRTVTPSIEPELFRKYVAFAQQSCYPRLTDEARQAIEDFYVDLRARGTDEDAPVPVTARKLEALVRLAEASARVRLSDTVELEDAERVIELVRSCLQDIGVDPETGQYDADVIETGRSKTQRDRYRTLKDIIRDLQDDFEGGVPRDEVLSAAEEAGIEREKAEHQIQKLRDQGEVFSPQGEDLRLV